MRRLVHIVLQIVMIGELAVVVQTDVLLLPLPVQGGLGALLVEMTLLDGNRPADAHVHRLDRFRLLLRVVLRFLLKKEM